MRWATNTWLPRSSLAPSDPTYLPTVSCELWYPNHRSRLCNAPSEHLLMISIITSQIRLLMLWKNGLYLRVRASNRIIILEHSRKTFDSEMVDPIATLFLLEAFTIFYKKIIMLLWCRGNSFHSLVPSNDRVYWWKAWLFLGLLPQG